MTSTSPSLAERIRIGDRRALAQGITLVESTRDDDRRQAEALLDALHDSGPGALRLGISGPPGAGKSTFIEAFGLYLIAAGRRIAVLAIDPSSPRSGGSILGDKTRMAELARHAFIRPSPASGALGGVARRTRESVALCAAAGFDVVMVETVGVGQSEVAVADMVDVVLLLLPPAGGDELQGIKKGIVEIADIVLVNKADGELTAAAGRTASEYQAALHLLGGRSGWTPPVLQVSAKAGTGLSQVQEAIECYRAQIGDAGLAAKRAAQARAWMWREVEDGLIAELRDDDSVTAIAHLEENNVIQLLKSPSSAARSILSAFRGRR